MRRDRFGRPHYGLAVEDPRAKPCMRALSAFFAAMMSDVTSGWLREHQQVEGCYPSGAKMQSRLGRRSVRSRVALQV